MDNDENLDESDDADAKRQAIADEIQTLNGLLFKVQSQMLGAGEKPTS